MDTSLDLKTPRTMPPDELITKWTNEIEHLLKEWSEVAHCYSYLHAHSERKYKRKYHSFSIPIIVLSTLTGTANFAGDSYIPESFQKSYRAIIGSFNILCGVLGTLLSFLKYNEALESHRISQVAWSKFARNIAIELALKDEKRKNPRDFLKVSRAEFDRLIESSPNIDRDIIKMFNRKFETKYPNVCKPIIVNGLREVVIYNSDEDMRQSTQSVSEPEPEPEPVSK